MCQYMGKALRKQNFHTLLAGAWMFIHVVEKFKIGGKASNCLPYNLTPELEGTRPSEAVSA